MPSRRMYSQRMYGSLYDPAADSTGSPGDPGTAITAKRWTFDFTDGTWNNVWTGTQIDTINGIQLRGNIAAGHTSLVIDATGMYAVGTGNNASSLKIMDLAELPGGGPDLRVGQHAFLLEFTDDKTHDAPFGIAWGDALDVGDPGYPTMTQVSRQAANVKLASAVGGWHGDQFTLAAAATIRAFGAITTPGQQRAYFHNSGGAGPGQVFPTQLDTWGGQTGTPGPYTYTVDYAGSVSVWMPRKDLPGDFRITRLTIWQLSPPDGAVEQF
ncbi:MAG: hypothetical protein GY788_21130 [bacterium]|nr:hypothetical protein [bacterium]